MRSAIGKARDSLKNARRVKANRRRRHGFTRPEDSAMVRAAEARCIVARFASAEGGAK